MPLKDLYLRSVGLPLLKYLCLPRRELGWLKWQFFLHITQRPKCSQGVLWFCFPQEQHFSSAHSNSPFDKAKHNVHLDFTERAMTVHALSNLNRKINIPNFGSWIYIINTDIPKQIVHKGMSLTPKVLLGRQSPQPHLWTTPSFMTILNSFTHFLKIHRLCEIGYTASSYENLQLHFLQLSCRPQYIISVYWRSWVWPPEITETMAKNAKQTCVGLPDVGEGGGVVHTPRVGESVSRENNVGLGVLLLWSFSHSG